jgi:hypothetical protein
MEHPGHALLLARRVPLDAIEVGRAYVIHARNGGVGVAISEPDGIGYVLHREKFGEHYLFTEWDWSTGEPFGTAIPLFAIDVAPPKDDDKLLAWLAEREEEHKDAIRDAWRVLLGPTYELAPKGGSDKFSGIVRVNGRVKVVGEGTAAKRRKSKQTKR